MKLEALIRSIQTFEIKLRPTKKKSVALKVDDSSSPNEDSNEEFALVAKKFKNFF